MHSLTSGDLDSEIVSAVVRSRRQFDFIFVQEAQIAILTASGFYLR